jgi:hypothetical protein
MERDTDLTMLSGIRILLIPSIIGGWWLSGLMPSNYIIFLPMWKKLFILMIILITGLIFITIRPKASPSNTFMRAVIIIWFMPKFIRPWLNQKGITYTKNRFKTREVSWSLSLTWG